MSWNPYHFSLPNLSCAISMIVCYLNIVWPCVSPHKADAVLVINSNAMLPLAITGESFQSVTGRHAEFIQ